MSQSLASQPTIYSHASYRSYLKACADSRIARNPSYSARAFAMQLGVTPAFFSEILSGKKHLSSDKAIEIGRMLALGDDETRYFGLLVQVEKAKSAELRQSLLLQMREIAAPGTDFGAMSLDRFESIAVWHHLAIRNLAMLDGFDLNAESAAKMLGISATEAQAAITRLESLGLIERNPATGRFVRTEGNLFAEAKDDSQRRAFKIFHEHMLERGLQTYKFGPSADRSLTSLTVAADADFLGKFEKLTDRFLRDINRLVDESTGKKTRVYHIALHGFAMTPSTSENP